MKVKQFLTTLSLMLFSGMAFAHTGEGINTGFASGFWRPIMGWDHVVAMVAARSGRKSTMRAQYWHSTLMSEGQTRV